MPRHARFVGLLALLVAGLAGCSAASSQKTLVVECDPKDPSQSDCPSHDPTLPKKKVVSSDDAPSTSQAAISSDTPSAPSAPPTKKPDSSVKPTPTPTPTPDPTPASGCSDLVQCCTALRSAGFTGSADQCDRTVADADDAACELYHSDAKKPSDDTDFVCQ